MPKWEYCSLEPAGKRVWVIRYYQAKGPVETSIPYAETDDFNDVSTTMAQLGMQGWELASVVNKASTGYNAYYFKRPLA